LSESCSKFHLIRFFFVFFFVFFFLNILVLSTLLFLTLQAPQVIEFSHDELAGIPGFWTIVPVLSQLVQSPGFCSLVQLQDE
jgi:hypothetical protein